MRHRSFSNIYKNTCTPASIPLLDEVQIQPISFYDTGFTT